METITDSALLKIAHEIFEPIPAKLSPGAWKQFDEITKKEHLNRVTMKVKFKKLHEGARLPEKATEGSAAYDLYVAEDIIIAPGRSVIPLGFAMEMEPGCEALIDPRSGFSCEGMQGYEVKTLWQRGAEHIIIGGHCKSNLHTLSQHLMDQFPPKKFVAMEPERFDCDVIEGKIDSDYRKGVGVIIHNRDTRTFFIKAGTRIAQMTFHKVETVQWEETEDLSETDRTGGFGSTGTK